MWRVRRRKTFDALRRSRRRARRGPITVTFVAGAHPCPAQVAYAVGRKVGGAVERNRLRRRLRAIVYEHRDRLRSGAYLVGAAPEAAALSFGELRTIVCEALQAANGERSR